MNGAAATHWRASSNVLEQYRQALSTREAERGYRRDWEAMQRADAFVLVSPSGRSSHLEMGWAIGAGKPACLFLTEPQEAELMYKMADFVAIGWEEVTAWLEGIERNGS